MIAEAITGVFQGVVKPVLDKFIPDAKDRLEAENMFFNMAHQVNMGQLEINKIEASSENTFVAGWRPFIGWVCGATLAYSVLGHAFFNFILELVNNYTMKNMPVLPAPDMTITLEILIAMLGLGGMRTYEKLKGVHKD